MTQADNAATVDLARGYAVPTSADHINRLACAVLALAEENERLREELQQARRKEAFFVARGAK